MKSWLARKENLLALLLLLFGAAVRAAWLLRQSLWSDEALTLLVSRSDSFWTLMRSLESAPPLHFIIMRWWLAIFPDPLAAMRVFSLLCGIASLWVFHRLARRVAPQASASALFIAAFSSYWVHSAQDGRFYGLYLLLALAQTSVFWELREADRPRLWLAYIVVSALGLYTHYFMLFLVLAQAGYVAVARIGSRRPILPALLAFGLIAALFAPWLPSLAAQARQRAGATLVVERFGLPQLGFITGTMFADLSYLGLVLIPWIKALGFLILAALAAGAVQVTRQAGSLRALLARWGDGHVFCLAHIALALAAFPLVELFVKVPLIQPRYFAFLSPFIFIFLAHLTMGRAVWRSAARIGIEIVLLAGLAGYYASNKVFNPRLDLLAAEARLLDPRSPIVHIHPYYYLPFRYYYMPERIHWLVPGHIKDVLDVLNLPGYPGIKRVKDLPEAGRCLVIDPGRRLRPTRVWPSTGAELSDLLARTGRITRP
ncbi:MAG: glycosyltransferase family 39 protein [Elusimicrobia bacterium]|nr:glycosyltransferase family 39 protein [Elusimicrobiota bacterium]